MRLISCPGAEELTGLIDKHLVRWAKAAGIDKETFIIPCDCPRFQSGDAKGLVKESVRGDDYIIPNNIVEDGQCDTNYFQHQPYLDDFNAEHGTHLVTVAGIHVEPMGIYGGKQDSLAPIEG